MKITIAEAEAFVAHRMSVALSITGLVLLAQACGSPPPPAPRPPTPSGDVWDEPVNEARGGMAQPCKEDGTCSEELACLAFHCSCPNRDTCEQRCGGGDAAACTALGRMHERSIDGPGSWAEAASTYRRGCDGGHPGSCTALGWLLLGGMGVNEDRTEAEKLATSACNRGDGDGCALLGNIELPDDVTPMYRRDWDWNPRDVNRARKLFERACTGNSSYGCRRYADVWFRGIGDGGANAGTSRLYDRKACELGSTWGCGDACGEGPACLTRARSNEEAGRPDKAIDSYSHLCVVGIAEACFHASRVYEEGIGRPPDPVGALVFQKMGCDKGYPRSCVPLARMLDERGKHDEATAKLEKGCADDGEESCHALAVRYAGGEHLPADPAKAVELFNTACDHEVAESCHALAELHAEGRGVPKSPAQAKAFHARACKLGYQASCPPAPSTFAPR